MDDEAALLEARLSQVIEDLRHCRDLLRDGVPAASVAPLAALAAKYLPTAAIPRPPPSVVRIHGGSIKDKVLAALTKRGVPLGFQDLIAATGAEPSAIAVSLRRAMASGLVVRLARGVYSLPSPLTASVESAQ